MASKLRIWLVVLYVASGLLAAAHAAMAQGLAGLLPKQNATTTTATDPLKRNTPRSAMYNFLQACHDENFSLAARYLDLRRIRTAERQRRGADLARDLGDVLNRDPQFELNHLSNNPEGNMADGLPPGIDEFYSVQLNGKAITLDLQRQTEQGVDVWLVSADSVLRIPELTTVSEESAIEKKLPQPLVRTKLIGTPLWVWFALILLALIISLLSRLFSRLVFALLRPVTNRYSIQAHRLEAFTEPLRLLLSVLVFRACMETVAPSALLRSYIINLLTLLFFLGAASLVMRIVDVVADRAIARLDPRQRSVSTSVFPLFVRIVKIFIFCFAVLLVLSKWGYSTSTILAGVGVGGIAVALAAQKTIENLFGSLSVIVDRPVQVGDFFQFGDQTGTVEDIGLRSTRIRTLNRTVVTIPNSVFSNMALENYSRRDRMWFHPTLQLRRDTTPDQIRIMMHDLQKMLEDHPKVDASGVPLRFTKITSQAFELEIFAYVLTPDANEFLTVQSELLLKILELASKLDIGFAVPFQETVTAMTRHDHPDFVATVPANRTDGAEG